MTEYRRSVRPATVVLGVVVVLLIAVRQAFTVPFTGLGLSPAQLLLLVLGALWVITRLIGQRAPGGLGVLSGLVVIQLLFTLISYGLSEGRFLTGDQRTQSNRGLLLLTVATAVVFVLVTVLRSRRDIEFVLQAMTIGGAVSGLFGLIQYATGVDVAEKVKLPGLRETSSVLVTELLREGLVRPQGSAAHPLELGAMMTVLVPIGLGVYFSARRRGVRAWPWAVLTAIIAAGGTVSLSRSLFLGIGAALIVMVPRWPVRRALGGLAALAVIVLVAALSGARLVNAISTLLVSGSQDYSLQSRADGRSYVYDHFADHFWFGQGPGTYDLSTQKVLDNQYLSQLMENGVTGLLLLVAVLVCALVYALRAATPGVDESARELANGVAGALAGVVVVSAVLDTSGFVQIFTTIWLLVGLAGAVWRLNVGPGRLDADPVLPDRDPDGFTPADRPDAVAVH